MHLAPRSAVFQLMNRHHYRIIVFSSCIPPSERTPSHQKPDSVSAALFIDNVRRLDDAISISEPLYSTRGELHENRERSCRKGLTLCNTMSENKTKAT